MADELKPQRPQRQTLLPIRQDRLPSQIPFNLLCCANALPQTFHHLVELLPESTTHKPYEQPFSLGSILTPFLVILTTNSTVPAPSRIPTFNPYALIIQVIRSMPLSCTSSPHEQTAIQQTSFEPRYFGMLEADLEEASQSTERDGERFKGKVFLEVERAEAEATLRFPGGGGEVIGDGEACRYRGRTFFLFWTIS